MSARFDEINSRSSNTEVQKNPSAIPQKCLRSQHADFNHSCSPPPAAARSNEWCHKLLVFQTLSTVYLPHILDIFKRMFGYACIGKSLKLACLTANTVTNQLLNTVWYGEDSCLNFHWGYWHCLSQRIHKTLSFIIWYTFAHFSSNIISFYDNSASTFFLDNFGKRISLFIRL